jgi:uncharacterized protein
MGSQKVEIVRALYDAFNGGDLHTMVANSHPDIEIHDLPDLPEAETFRGREGLKRMLALNLEPWESFKVEIERMVEVGDDVVVLVRNRVRARDGLEFDQGRGAIFTVREGLVARVRYFSEQHQALEAAGLKAEA